jgi:proteasome lid subunit RPN8/RPN11
MKLSLPASLQAQIIREAITAYPRECCGLLEGVEEAGAYCVIALHPGRNRAQAADRFELDPADHVAALKAARARGHVLIGCYHSHPDGAAKPSYADRAGAAQEDFIWLIAATDGAQCQLAAFVYRAPDFEELILAVGAEWVTSSLKERN